VQDPWSGWLVGFLNLESTADHEQGPLASPYRRIESLAWLLANRSLTVRYERRADILQAFLRVACALVCARRLQPL
jgi:hypothetical protein